MELNAVFAYSVIVVAAGHGVGIAAMLIFSPMFAAVLLSVILALVATGCKNDQIFLTLWSLAFGILAIGWLGVFSISDSPILTLVTSVPFFAMVVCGGWVVLLPDRRRPKARERPGFPVIYKDAPQCSKTNAPITSGRHRHTTTRARQDHDRSDDRYNKGA